ncbi:MAG: DUF1653 domain-containing protein [Mollicutes bacterium]|jgi:hypothetical protein|nr:DUF1653 domain-containing protein [Mollicutes bacterium]
MDIKIKGIYRHFKGHLYIVECIATHTETLEELVIYRNLETNEIWARPSHMFLAEVNKNNQKYRFELQK